MRPYRAIPIGGKDFVYGWYTEAKDYYKEKKHFIILNNSRFYPFVDGAEKIIEPREYSVNIIEVIPETVGQQVGLRDKNNTDNGTEIYASDIIETSAGTVYTVEWAKIGWNPFVDHCIKPRRIERIIGNIHQNPEIMEQDNADL